MVKKITKNKRVLLAMSGGIDSSISLIILKNQKYEVIGVSFLLPVWTPNKQLTKKIIEEKREIFKRIKDFCQQLGVKHYLLDLRKDFEKKVVHYFLNNYKKGFTPNPCVYCNYYFKFHHLLKISKKLNTDFIATGHYARIFYNPLIKKYQLLKAKDKKKDQSYYLSFLDQKMLKKTIFPLGGFYKKEVYRLVKKYHLNFEMKEYKESQNFCYLNPSSVKEFLINNIRTKKGLILEKETSKILGSHNGFYLFTLGQRKGLKLSKGPYYVVKIDPLKNLVYVSKNKNLLSKREIYLSSYHLISEEKIKKPFLAEVKIRSQQKPIKSRVSPWKKGLKIEALEKSFVAPAPSQVAVFYRKDVVLGGGIISR